MTTGHGLARREPEDLPGRSPDLHALIIPKSRHHSLHRHCLLSRPKNDVLGCRGVTDVRSEGEPRPRQTLATGHTTAPALPRLSKAFRQVGETWNSQKNGGTFLGPGTISAACPVGSRIGPALGHSAAIGFRTCNTSEVDSISPSQYLISASRLRSTQRVRSASLRASR